MKKYGLGLLLLTALLGVLLAGCAPEPFEEVPIPSTEAAETTVPESTTLKANDGEFMFAGRIKMGMRVGEVQKAIGQVSDVKMVDDRKSFKNEFSGIFINTSTTKNVIFMFEPKTETLEQMQFRCHTSTDGANTKGAIALFDRRYGKQGVYTSKYVNHIWKSGNVYILLSEINPDSYAVTYTEETYFAQNYKEELQAYKQAK